MRDIHAAFADVTRGERGISWSETYPIDNCETEEECAAVRLSDTDSHWNERVEKPDWQPFSGSGGSSFISVEGFR